jgi:hypothetical protein
MGKFHKSANNARIEALKNLGENRLLGQVVYFDLSYILPPEGAQVITRFSSKANQLKYLDITGGSVDNFGIRDFISSWQASNLQMLKIGMNSFDGLEFARMLAIHKTMPQLRKLEAVGIEFDRTAFELLASNASLSNLQHIKFKSEKNLNIEGLKSFVMSPHLVDMKDLCIIFCEADRIHDSFIESLSHYCTFRKLETINISGARFSIRTFIEFTRSKIGKGLKCLKIFNKTKAIKDMWEHHISMDELECLFCGESNLDDENFINMVTRSNFPSLRQLDVSNNSISENGVLDFSKSQLAKQIEELDIGGNRIGAQGLEVLVDSKCFPMLKKLTIGNISLPPQTIEAITSNVKNIEFIDAHHNYDPNDSLPF